MRAIVLEDQAVYQDSRPEPVPKPGEVLVRVLQAGVCETDLQLIKGYMGFRGVLGHEFVGVAESGPLESQRVVGEINCACQARDTCKAGLQTHCPNRTVLGILNHDGAFADRIAVPQVNLHAVPDTISTDVAVFTEPVAAAYQIPAQLSLARSDRIVVLGDGRLGNLCAQVLAGLSDHVIVVGKHPEKLALLQARGVATALAYPRLGERGREYFTRTGARLVDDLKLSREQVAASLRAEVEVLQKASADAADPAAYVDSVMQPCLSALAASGL